MSASFYWNVSKQGKNLPVNAGSDFMGALIEIFGEQPWTFKETDARIIRAMAASSNFNKDSFNRLADIIEQNGSIILKVEY